MSYWLCKAPAVGASGAIFGLVSGSLNTQLNNVLTVGLMYVCNVSTQEENQSFILVNCDISVNFKITFSVLNSLPENGSHYKCGTS